MIYLVLFFTFFKIGLFTFGGGYAMLPLIEKEVAAKGWMDASELVNFIAVSESTPGPFAVNVSTYVGCEVAGALGALCATLGVVLPSCMVILIVAKCFEKFKASKMVKGCMSGLKPAVIGLIASALISVGMTAFFPEVLYPNGITSAFLNDAAFYISVITFVIMTVLAIKKLHPIIIISASAGIGIACGYIFEIPL